VLRVRLLVGLALAVAAVAAAAVAFAASGGRTAGGNASAGPFDVWGSLDGSGNPEPTIVGFPEGTVQTMHWSLCASSAPGGCRRIPTQDGSAHPGPEPAGTVFRFTARDGRRMYSTSLTWRGPLRTVTLPMLKGRAAFGATVRAVGARWSGGWGAEDEQLGIEACRTARATGCVMLSGEELDCSRSGACGSNGGDNSPDDHVRVGNPYVGWYLFALDAHVIDGINGLVGYSEQEIPPWRTSIAVARSAPYGPVTGPPAPTVKILRRGRIRGRRVLFASLHCTVRCRAQMSVYPLVPSLRGWGSSTNVTGTQVLGVAGPLPAERMQISVTVGDGPAVAGVADLTGPPAWQDLSAEYLAQMAGQLASYFGGAHHGSYAKLTPHRLARTDHAGFSLHPGDGAWLIDAFGTKTTYTVTAKSATGRSFSYYLLPDGGNTQTCAPNGGGCTDARWPTQP
jgi:hypothetical protein